MMSSAPLPRAQPPRLNPFAFPSDTTFRFVLLIVAVLGTSLFIYHTLFFHFNGAAYSSAFFECRNVRETAVPAKTINPADLRSPNKANDILQQCLASTNRWIAAWMAGGVALVMSLAGVLYGIFPAWMIWRGQLTPLQPEDAPEVVAYMAELCRDAQLSRQPRIVWNPLNTANNGLAFGYPGHYYIALSGGIVAQFYTDKSTFRAIMLHELAHLRNGDIGKTYFTVAIWRAFVVAALLPFAITLINRGDALGTFMLIVRMLALVALVYLTRNAILRAREVYADVRASAWDGPTGRLGYVLARLPRSIGGRWRALLRVHPDPAERRHALDNPSRLFRLGFWDAVGTGVAATITFANVELLLTNLTRDPLWPSLGAGLIFAPLVAGVIGFGVWRATFAVLVRGEGARDAWRVGLGLGLGAILGQALALDQAPFDVIEQSANDQITQYGLESLWSLLLLTSLIVFLAWVTACASTWLEVAMTRRSPGLVASVGAAVAGSVLAVWLGLLFATHDSFLTMLALGGAGIPVFAASIMYLLTQPLVPLALICVWAFPLAAWFWHRRSLSPSIPSWAFLDPASRSFVLLPQALLRPGLALWAAVIGSVPFFGLLLLAWSIRRWGMSEALRGSDQAIQIFYYGQILFAALVQAIIAAVVAGLVQRLGALHGLFAAFAAGCLMTITILGLHLAFGGTIDLPFVWRTYALVVNGGALLTLPLALFVAALAGWVRRARRASSSRRAANAALLQQLLTDR